MMRSLFSGVSGLKNHQTRMDVIGDNIANVNTTGFKGSRVTFQDMLTQTLTGAAGPQGNRGGTNPQQIGLGVGLSSIDTLFTDGSVQATGKNTDLAISGNGFFIVSDGAKNYYTRNGGFEFDEAGNYVLPGSGLKVKGWMGDGKGNVSTSNQIQDIIIPKDTSMQSTITTKTTGKGNLSATDKGPVKQTKYGLESKPGDDIPKLGETTVNEKNVSTKVVGIYQMEVDNPAIPNDLKVGEMVYDALGKTVLGKVKSVGTPANKAIIETIGMNQPPTALYRSDGVNPPVALTTVEQTNISYVMKVALPNPLPNPLPKVGDIVYDAAGTTAIGEVTSVGDTDFTFKTTDDGRKLAPGTPNVPTAITVGTIPFNAGISEISNNKDSITYKGGYWTTSVTLGPGVTAPKAGDDVYNQAGVKIGVVTKVDGSTFEYISSSLGHIPSGTPYLKKSDGTTSAYGTVTGTPTQKAVYSYNAEVNTPGDFKTTSFFAYDSQGAKHMITGTVTKTKTNTWEFVPKSLADTGAVVTGEPIVITFDDKGKCISGKGNIMITPIDPPLGSQSLSVEVDFTALTQYASDSNVDMGSDGNAAGTLQGVSLDSSGMIIGSFSNDMKLNLACVALATFNNPSGLTKEGSSLYSASNNSGDVGISTAGSGGAGSLTPNSIEMSNVNLSDQFSDMIITQRGFQSNSKIITVSDEMVETLVNLKR